METDEPILLGLKIFGTVVLFESVEFGETFPYAKLLIRSPETDITRRMQSMPDIFKKIREDFSSHDGTIIVDMDKQIFEDTAIKITKITEGKKIETEIFTTVEQTCEFEPIFERSEVFPINPCYGMSRKQWNDACPNIGKKGEIVKKHMKEHIVLVSFDGPYCEHMRKNRCPFFRDDLFLLSENKDIEFCEGTEPEHRMAW